MSYILRYEKLLSAVGLDMQSIDGTAQYWGINDLVNRHTLNYTEVDHRKLILRFHRIRGKAELLAADSQEAGAMGSSCHGLGPSHQALCATASGVAVGSPPPWLPCSITGIALFKGHTRGLILNVKLILRDQKMLFPGSEELSGKIFIKGTSLNFCKIKWFCSLWIPTKAHGD